MRPTAAPGLSSFASLIFYENASVRRVLPIANKLGRAGVGRASEMRRCDVETIQVQVAE